MEELEVLGVELEEYVHLILDSRVFRTIVSQGLVDKDVLEGIMNEVMDEFTAEVYGGEND